MLAAILMMTACDGQARGKHMDRPPSVLAEMIERVRAAGMIDVRVVEQVTGATLRETDDSNDAFTFYRAGDVKSGDQRLGVDLRVPVAGGGATGGPLLVLNVSGACMQRAQLEARYGPLTLTQAPRGDSAEEEAHWSRQEAWGRLSFGFPARTPDCLGSVVLESSRRVGRA